MTKISKILGIQGGVPRFSGFRGDLSKWGEVNYSGGVETPVGGMCTKV